MLWGGVLVGRTTKKKNHTSIQIGTKFCLQFKNPITTENLLSRIAKLKQETKTKRQNQEGIHTLVVSAGELIGKAEGSARD